MTLLLYTSVESACAQKVRLVMAEKQLSWEERALNLRRGDQFDPAYLKLNPKAVVPTLVHDGLVIRESTVINEYLDEVFPEPPLKPADPGLRSQMRLWAKMVDDEVHPAIGVLTYAVVLRQQMNEMKSPQELALHFQRITDPKRRERQQQAHELGLESPTVTAALENLKEIIGQMDSALTQGSWLCGSHYSIADAAFAPYMVRLEALKMDALWNNAPQFSTWLKSVSARKNARSLKNTWGSPSFIELVQKYATQAAPEIAALMPA